MDTLPLWPEEDNPSQKRCTQCGAQKPATPAFFYRQKLGKYGVQSICKVCTSTNAKRYYSQPEVRTHQKDHRQEYYARPVILPETQQCTGPCARTLSATPDYFHRYKNRLRTRCKDCRSQKKPSDVSDGYKRCQVCRNVFPATTEYFFRHETGAYGLRGRCKLCYSLDVQRYVSSEKTPPQTKQCPTCHLVLPANRQFFVAQRHHKDGLSHHCKSCMSVQARARYRIPSVREQALRQKKEYAHRPQVRARIRAYSRAYYSHPEKRAYRRAYMRNYYRVPERRLRYRPGEISRARTRRARNMMVTGVHTPAQIQELLKRQRYRCYYCSMKFLRKNGKHVYHIEHTFPLSRVAGTNIPANDISYLVLACPSCNLSKGNKYPWEWGDGGRLL